METSLKEDYLESLFQYSLEHEDPPDVSEFMEYMNKPIDEVEEVITVLEKEGDIERDHDLIRLLPKGRDLGQKTMRKHRILECFLTEVLDMDPGTASDEACTLEHKVSDDAIDRLRMLIRNPRNQADIPCKRRFRAGWRFPSLLDFPEGSELVIKDVGCHGSMRRLADLGIFPGEKITLERKLTNNAVVVRVKGCDIALSPEIASFLSVEQTE